MAWLDRPHDDAAASPLRRLGSVAAGLGCGPAELLALAVLVTGAVAVLGVLWLTSRPSDVPPGSETGAPSPVITVSAAPTTEELVVHVAGKVQAPGLYRLPAGARVADALEAAGGTRRGALVDAVNLARPLADGEQLVVPDKAQASAAAPGGAGAARPDGTLDLNRATAEELETLPGIGPVLAERIVAHREEVGGFNDVSQLHDVTGIGEKTFEAIAELVGL